MTELSSKRAKATNLKLPNKYSEFGITPYFLGSKLIFSIVT